MNDAVGRRALTLRLVPWLLVLVAGIFLVIAAFIWHEGKLHGRAWLIFVVPVVVGLFFEVTTVTIDQDTREVRLRRARPWGASERRFSFEEVVAVMVEGSTSGRSRTYGVVLALRSGDKVPLQSSTSSGRGSKQHLAQTLADAISQGRSAPITAALDGVFRESSSGSTDGIRWTLDHIDRGNEWELTRFWTDAARLGDGFLFVAPASAAASTPPLGGGGALGAFLRTIVQQYLRALDLTEADLPHRDRTVTLEHEPLSRAGFVVSSSAPDAARRWLDAGAAALLAEWQQRPVLRAGRALEPHLVLGPTGLRLIFRKCMRQEPEVARIHALGLALTRIVPR